MSQPLVNSEGNLDPFDGLVTYRLLQQAGECECRGSRRENVRGSWWVDAGSSWCGEGGSHTGPL